jgi:hypothetical protein
MAQLIMIWASENTRCFINDSNLIETGLWDKHLRGTTQWSSRPNIFFCHIDCKIGHTLDSKSLSVVEILRNMNAKLSNWYALYLNIHGSKQARANKTMPWNLSIFTKYISVDILYQYLVCSIFPRCKWELRMRFFFIL